MIQLLLHIIISLIFSYTILVVIYKYKLKIKFFIITGLCFYLVEVGFYIYFGTRVPEGAIPVTEYELLNPR